MPRLFVRIALVLALLFQFIPHGRASDWTQTPDPAGGATAATKRNDAKHVPQEAFADPTKQEERKQADTASYKPGQVVEARFFLKNAGKDPIVVTGTRGVVLPGDYKMLRVVDKDGAPVPTQETMTGPGGRIVGPRLAAGQQAVMSGFPIAIGDGTPSDSVKTMIKAKPGQTCRVQFMLHDDLQTGEFTFRVLPKDAPEPKQLTPVELKKHIAWGKPSKSGLQVGLVLVPWKEDDRPKKLPKEGKQKPEPVTLGSFEEGVLTVAFSPGGDLAVSGGEDGVLRFWDVGRRKPSGELVAHARSIRSVAFSPNGELLASAGDDKTVRFWRVATRKELATLKGHTELVTSLAFSPDGRFVASGGADGMLIVWDVAAQSKTATFRAFDQPVLSVAFSPEGSTLATADRDGNLQLREGPKWHEKSTAARIGVRTASLAFSPDGKSLALGGLFGLKVVEFPQLREQAVLEFPGGGTADGGLLNSRTSRARRVVFSPDGRKLAVAIAICVSAMPRPIFEGEIALWDINSSHKAVMLRGHRHEVTSVAFSPDGKTLISGSMDGTVKLWDLAAVPEP